MQRCNKWLKAFALVCAMAGLGSATAYADDDFCWRASYGRGVGTPMNACKDASRAPDEALCYKKCGADEDGVATQCVKNCPSGFRNDGLYCGKPGGYDRGAGYVAWDEAKCNREHSQGCEKNGLIWYPRCKANFHVTSVTRCEANCPGGWQDIGVSCKKPSSDRGIGTVLDACANGKQLDAGLCYDQCKSKYNGVGPVCWGQCPPSTPVDCGAGCATSQTACGMAIMEQVTTVLDVAANVLTTVTTFGAGTAAKAAATTSAKTAIKNAGKQALKGASKSTIKASLKKIAKDQGKTIAENQLEELSKGMAGEDFDPTTLDPTGIASLVKAYNKPICKV